MPYNFVAADSFHTKKLCRRWGWGGGLEATYDDHVMLYSLLEST